MAKSVAQKARLYVVLHNHFDPIWRRCWKRDFVFRGRRYRSYAHIEEEVFERWLTLAESGKVCISEGQTVILRTYLEKHPERLALVRRLVKEGRFEVPVGGEVVPDLNMPTGESLVRNFVMGAIWAQDTLGATSEVGWLEDAFGQSAQVPQIMRGVGVRWVARLCYAFVPGSHWRGIDGSVVAKHDFVTAWAGNNIKYGPCPECNGYGCTTCRDTGVQDDGGIPVEHFEKAIREVKLEPNGYGLLYVGNEEHYVNMDIEKIIARLAKERTDLDIRYGTWADLMRESADALDQCDDPKLKTSDEVEGNPTSSGTHVSRIKTKQWNRKLETLLLQAEQLAAFAMVRGAEYPKNELLSAWQDLAFTTFHDAITATHVNAAYFELLDMYHEIEVKGRKALNHATRALSRGAKTDGRKGAPIVVFNTCNWDRSDAVSAVLHLDAPLGDGQTLKVVDSDGAEQLVEKVEVSFLTDGRDATVTFIARDVPACGYRVFYAEPAKAKALKSSKGLAIENEFYRVECDKGGIAKIVDKSTGKTVTAEKGGRANGLTVEEDCGNPWGTMKTLGPQRSLDGFVESVTREDDGAVQRIIVKGRDKHPDPDVLHLAWRQEIRIQPGIARIEFKTEIDWDTRSRRVRVVFPLASSADEARYEIPYGNLLRKKYEPRYHYNAPNGDWPAINWVDVALKGGGGVALFNQGLPSHRVEGGVLALSLLRSPEQHWCLNEPEFYDCPDFDGVLDRGHHVFEYALAPHKGDYIAGNIVQRAKDYVFPLVARAASRHDGESDARSFVTIEGKGIVIGTVKRAERGNELVIRAYEAHGAAAKAAVSVADSDGTIQTARLDETERADVKAGAVPFRAFEIKTLVVTGS